MVSWSRNSLRIKPISLSSQEFFQGDREAVIASLMSRLAKERRTPAQ
jgi:hypothetical protein